MYRKKYDNNLKLNRVTDNRTFWKTIKPFLSYKGTNINKITLVDNNKMISDIKQLCKTFINFFQEAMKTVGVSDNFNMLNYSHSDPINNAIGKCETYASVKKISETITITIIFSFLRR